MGYAVSTGGGVAGAGAIDGEDAVSFARDSGPVVIEYDEVSVEDFDSTSKGIRKDSTAPPSGVEGEIGEMDRSFRGEVSIMSDGG